MTNNADFWHERLDVYQHALRFISRAEKLIAEHSTAGAVLDHLDRASESMAENIVTGNSQWSADAKCRYFGVAYGSALECAACMDVFRVKGAIQEEQCDQEKVQLRTIVRMLVGLIRSQKSVVCEPSAEYAANAGERSPEFYFDHERLEVYQFALRFVGWVDAQVQETGLVRRRRRKLDALSTSIALNIAEGNGRFGASDHRSFVDIAHRSALKAALQLDLIRATASEPAASLEEGKRMLGSIVRMLLGLRGYLNGQ